MIDQIKNRARPGRRSWMMVLFATGMAVTIAGCSAVQQAPQTSGGAEAAFGHVHGIGIDSVTGAAFAATHGGMFQLPTLDSGPVKASELDGPIAGRGQDTMGFTMSGGVMYGSGHPDPAEQPDLNPPNLGLITSDDDAATWQPISLRGQADFHDLAVTQDGTQTRIYGYDESAGTISVSADGGKTWTTGTRLALRDLSVDPDQPDTIYASTADGLAISTDAAHTFTVVEDAPILYLLDSLDDAAGGLIGVDVDGTVWVKEGAGQWESTGTVNGQVEALTYSPAPTSRLVVATARGIMASDDLGGTWRDVVLN